MLIPSVTMGSIFLYPCSHAGAEAELGRDRACSGLQRALLVLSAAGDGDSWVLLGEKKEECPKVTNLPQTTPLPWMAAEQEAGLGFKVRR